MCICCNERTADGRQLLSVRVFGELRNHLGRMGDEDNVLLVFIAEKMAGWASGLKRKGPVDA